MPFFIHPLAPIGCAVACLLASVAQAQNATPTSPDARMNVQATLPEVLVTPPQVADHSNATRAEWRLQGARQALAERAGGTALVSAADFSNGKTSTFSDMLSFAPGVYAQTRHGDETRLGMRGSGIQRGFLLRGIELYQDGIPLNTADGSGDFQLVDALATDYIEVWRGANALEYGAGVLGGAMNFVSPTGLTAPRAVAQLQAGSYGFKQAHAAFSAHGEVLDGYLSATRSLQDGYRVQSGSQATRIQGNVGMRFSPVLDGRVYFAHLNSKLQMPGSISGAMMDEDPKQAGANYQRLNAHNNYRVNRLAAQLNWRPNESVHWRTSAYLNQRDRDHAMTYGYVMNDFRDAGLDTRAAVDFGEAGLVRKLAAGARYQRMHGDETRFANPDGQPGRQTGLNTLTATQGTVYAEYSHGLTQQWIAQVGVQGLKAQRELRNRVAAANSYKVDYSGLNPKLGLIYQWGENTQFYGNVSRSREVPPFGELVVSNTLPLADAQKAITTELGWRTNSAPWQADVALYRSRIQGELLSMTDATGAALGTVNADRTLHQGLEANAAWTHGAWRLRGNYLYSDFHFKRDAIYGNNTLAGFAPHLLNLEARWQAAPALWLALALETRTGTTWIDHANTVSSGGFSLLNLGVGGEVQKGLSWFVQGKNLADRRYASSTAVQANARGADGNWYFPGDGRAFYAGVRWALE